VRRIHCSKLQKSVQLRDIFCCVIVFWDYRHCKAISALNKKLLKNGACEQLELLGGELDIDYPEDIRRMPRS